MNYAHGFILYSHIDHNKEENNENKKIIFMILQQLRRFSLLSLLAAFYFHFNIVHVVYNICLFICVYMYKLITFIPMERTQK